MRDIIRHPLAIALWVVAGALGCHPGMDLASGPRRTVVETRL